MSKSRSNLCLTGVPEGEKTQCVAEAILRKIKTENFLELMKDVSTQILEAQPIAGRTNREQTHLVFHGETAEFQIQEKV